jgi:hypothetical protein
MGSGGGRKRIVCVSRAVGYAIPVGDICSCKRSFCIVTYFIPYFSSELFLSRIRIILCFLSEVSLYAEKLVREVGEVLKNKCFFSLLKRAFSTKIVAWY